MPQAFIAALPPSISLDLNCKIVFEAVDPSDGSPVSDVKISAALLRVNTDIPNQLLPNGPFMLVPGPQA